MSLKPTEGVISINQVYTVIEVYFAIQNIFFLKHY